MAPTREEVAKIKEHLVKALDEGKLSTVDDLLENLKDVKATTELLKATGIGVAVNSIRKHQKPTGEQKDLAKRLVAKWRSDVANNTESQKFANGGKKPAAQVKKDSTTSSRRPSGSASANRTIDSDGLKINSTGENVRDRCIGLLYAALASDTTLEGQAILSKAQKLEQLTFEKHGDINGTYKARVRSLCFNLKDTNNPDLCDRVLAEEITIERLANMTSDEMASKARKEAAKEAIKDALHDAIAAADTSAETDMFQCGKCKQRRTKYYQMQTRSADEPMTTFVTCLACGNRWKFC